MRKWNLCPCRGAGCDACRDEPGYVPASGSPQKGSEGQLDAATEYSTKTSPRICASQLFNEDEIKVLDGIFSTLLRGGDPKILMRSPAAKNVMRKVAAMKASIERQKTMRAMTEQRTRENAPCTCTTLNTSYEANPQGHDVGCPRWGTTLPNDSLDRLTSPGTVG